MFKQFNKQFYRSYDFHTFLLFILIVTSNFMDRDLGILSVLMLLFIPFHVYKAFWSTRGNMQENWKIWLWLAVLVLGNWQNLS